MIEPRQYSVVKFRDSYRVWALKQDVDPSSNIAAFFACDFFWYLGIIPNKGSSNQNIQHCLVVDTATRRIFEGHPDLFEEVVQDITTNNPHCGLQAEKANRCRCICGNRCRT